MNIVQNLSFIDPSKNDKLSQLRGIDLQDLIFQIENSCITYRDSLGLPKNASFGIELEYEDVSVSLVDCYIYKNLPEWESKRDWSLDSGGEIASSILHDKIKDWKNLKSICDYLKENKANTCNKAGGHIHIGTHILGKNSESFRKFLKAYITYESVLFRFAYGDKISARKTLYDFAAPIADELYYYINYINQAKTYEEIIVILEDNKYQAINFSHAKYSSHHNRYKEGNTIEFRFPNSTTEEVVWQNNINTLTKLMISPYLDTFDEDFLNYKLKKERISSENDFYMYNEVCLKNALEFVDLIFNNNLDKVYFLRQYLKGFQSNYGMKEAVMSKKFIS